jgi:hydrogenase maturation factor
MGLLASGALLVAADRGESARMVGALQAAGIPAAIIGQVVGGAPIVQVQEAGGLAPLPTFARDELARLFEGSSV